MAEPHVDYQISAADAHELAGAVLLPADLRRQVLEKMAAQRDPATMRRALTALGIIAALGLAMVGLVEIFPIVRTLAAWQAGCFG
ncbi:hypothetical protein [Pseudomonas aeruginosa]|uniref:hypothetical protein n=1 Tax=Pseudomonas aeruginosa TaxID=287 RepID=UPI002238FEDA|nr:hypothetical protein [Pseudomonas aeruginosa]MCW5377815.1 hypothetical protein [Pseudomonas aeruginosa]